MIRVGGGPLERSAEILVRFALADGVRCAFKEAVEVALDCCVCRRCDRTIRFEKGRDAICLKTGHAFPGKLLAVEVAREGNVASAHYRIRYTFEDFVDARLPEARPSAQPSWARVYIRAICPRCGSANDESTQNNLVRPFTSECECGFELYTEEDKMPIIRAGP
jgi:hypothetical protein